MRSLALWRKGAKVKNPFKTLFREKKFAFLALILSLGIIFLFLSEYSFDGTTEKNAAADTQNSAQALEERLCEILSQMEGVDDVHVFILLEESLSADASPFSSDESSRRTPVIRGVSVVCAGAKNVHLKRKIILLVASTLNLNENQIYVTE